jgi:flavin reductase (DIM6/NTAB) family NADH-FMN oxidoreductase RutF
VSPVDGAAFRRAMRHYPTGVTVVTSLHQGEPRGMTVSAFASVSADPPMVLVCVNRDARSYLFIASSRIFCVNVLASDQRQLAERFAGGVRDRQFDGIAHTTGATGAPVLDGTVAFFDCAVDGEHKVGSHSIFIGRVLACEARADQPLGYLDGTYSDFTHRGRSTHDL